jgi:N-formylglutamate amidohydrolase
MTIPDATEWVDALRSNGRIHGRGRLGGFAYTVDGAAPYIATAIHAGGNVRDDLLPLMQISAAGRYFEEDPETDTMIRDAASAVWGLDARSEYDLNRPPADALPLAPEQFWGTRVYSRQPTPAMNRAILAKHDEFYAFMAGWVDTTLKRFGVCLVYDVHAYNITRQMKKGIASPPVFNLGTAAIDRLRWAASVDDWLNRLEKIEIPGVRTTVAENLVFTGKGELCRRLSRWDPRILVLPTEVSKIYMDERTGRVDRAAVDALRDGLGQAMQAHSRSFLGTYGPVQERAMPSET